MTSPGYGSTTDELIQHRRDVADLQRRIRNRRLQVAGLYGTPSLLALSIFAWIATKNTIWLNKDMPGSAHGAFLITAVVFAAASALQFGIEFTEEFWDWEDKARRYQN